MATLAVTSGPNAGQRYELGVLTVIGRYPFCDIQLDMSNVSREHARIVNKDGTFTIEDLNSQNGTFVNGQRLTARSQLKHNDRINIYQVALLFIDESAIGEETREGTSPECSAPQETRLRGPNVVEAVDATSDSRIIANAEEKWRASLSLLRSLGRSLDVDEMLGLLLDDLFRIFPHADRGYILLVEEDGSLVLQALKEDGGTNVDHTLGPVDQTLAEQVIEQGEAVLCLDEDVGDSESVLDLPIRSIMCTPLISPLRKRLGALYIDTKHDSHRFGTEDLELLVGVAAVAGQSVAFARQHQLSVREHQRHTQQLNAEINERKRIESELRRSNNELQEFAYIASHDLQEPLRAVIGFVQLLAQTYEDKLDEQVNGYIQQAVDGGLRMQRLIDDLLEYSRVRTRGAPFESTNCNEVLEAVLSNLTVAIEESAAQVVSEDLPTINADRSQLIQVLQNLISNAIKFRSDDPPIIRVSAERRNDEWVFSVSDNGIGISAEYSERVFKMFQRLHRKEAYPGSGIGLAICRKVVERHGGKIWLDKSVECGAIFRFSIPLAASEFASDAE